jgi:hypothetical protein
MSTINPLVEISTALADIAEALERGDARAADAARTAALEIVTPLAELLEAVKASGADATKAVAEAIAATRQQEPPVINVPAPNVTVSMPPTAGWRFDVDYHPNGAIKGLTARRLET